MKKTVVLIIFATQLFFVPSAFAQTTSGPERDKLMEKIQLLLKQIENLQALIQKQEQTDSFNSLILSPTATIDVRYRVHDANQTFWVENKQHKQIIDRFVKLSPDYFDERYDEFVFFSNEPQDIDAFVETIDGFSSWRVGFSGYAASQSPYDAVSTELIVHELAHVIAYERFEGEEYLELFKNTFWRNGRTYTSSVSEYATENSDEDFAESFMTYVLKENYRGQGKEKVSWFGKFPEMIKYRDEIRSNL